MLFISLVRTTTLRFALLALLPIAKLARRSVPEMEAE